MCGDRMEETREKERMVVVAVRADGRMEQQREGGKRREVKEEKE